MEHSRDYHDYVFKKGKFIGRFEEMYRYSSEIPWHQNKTAYWIFSDIDIAILEHFKFGSICDIGCGLGYFTNRLYKELNFRVNRPKVTGVDISPAAIEKAQSLFPQIRFVRGDSLKRESLPKEKFDLVVAKETLWYVCNALEGFLQNVLCMVKNDGLFYVSQSFPREKKWVGQEVIDSPQTLKNILAKYTAPIHYCVEYDPLGNERPLIHFLGRKC